MHLVKSFSEIELPNGLRYAPAGYAGAGVDSVWEQKKLEARKILVNRAASPVSGARFVGRLMIFSKPTHVIF
jgi:hypothetical protein